MKTQTKEFIPMVSKNESIRMPKPNAINNNGIGFISMGNSSI